MPNSSPEEKEAWLESLLLTRSDIVDVDAFLIVLKAYGESSTSGSPQKAEYWIIRLERLAEENWKNPRRRLEPTMECYQAVIDSWLHATQEARNVAVNRAERWLQAMCERNMQPTTACYNVILNICSSGRGHINRAGFTESEVFAVRAEEIFYHMMGEYQRLGENSPIIPNTDSFNFVLRAWTRCRRDPKVGDRAIHLLKLFENSQDSYPHIIPNTKSYCMVLDALAISARMKARSCSIDKKEDRERNGMDELKRMEHIIKYMHELYHSGRTDVAPSNVAYNTLLSAWARVSGPIHPNAPFKAEEVLRHMTSLKNEGFSEAFPDSLSYTQVMLAWRNSGRVNAGERATWWLRKQWQDYMFTEHPALKPTLQSYNSLIHLWEKELKPEEAEDIFLLLLEHEKDESYDLKPDSESFGFIINAWLKAECLGKFPTGACFSRALHWLDEAMARDQSGIKTPPSLFVSLVKASRKCASLGPEILEKVGIVFDKFRESSYDIEFSAYSLFLHVVLDTLSRPAYDELRTNYVTKLVEKCREDGLVSNSLIKALANSDVYRDGWTTEESARLTKELFPSWPLAHDSVRNVPTSYRPELDNFQRTNFDTKEHKTKDIF